MDSSQLPEARVTEMIAGVAAYLRQERDLYFKASEPLTPIWKSAVQPYFSNTLIECVRIVTLEGARIPPPPFYSEAMAMSQGSFPDFVHLASFTYIDVIVFNDQITSRPLFHGLVHAAQTAVLGLDRYVNLYVRGLGSIDRGSPSLWKLRLSSWTRALRCPRRTFFLVEKEIRLWAEGGRYQ
jgi:hypothetical protein